MRLGVTCGVEIVRVELVNPLEHFAVLLITEMVVRAVAMPSVERVIAEHVESFLWEAVLHDFIDNAIVREGHMHFDQTAVRLVDAEPGLILRVSEIGVCLEIFRKDDGVGVRAAGWESIAYAPPLRLAIEAQYLAKIVHKTHRYHPARMAVPADGLRRLQ